MIKNGLCSIWNLKLKANVNFMIKRQQYFYYTMTTEWGNCVNENLAICFHFKMLYSKHKCSSFLALV